MSDVTLYETVGGMAFFERLVDVFYDGVEADAVLLGLYPDPTDLGPARRRFALFLAQYWGGPTRYNDERGHPRLRMRHGPFAIDPDARDRWLTCIRHAVDVCAPPVDAAVLLLDYFEMAAEAMRNRD